MTDIKQKALVERLLDFDDNWHEATCKEAADRIEALEAENEHLKRQLSQIAWLAQRPYDPGEQLTGGEGCASEGQAGSEA